MSKPLEITVERVPSDRGVRPNSVLVSSCADGASALELYERFSEALVSCRAREPAVAIVSTDVLNTPDQVRAIGRQQSRDTFEMNLEIFRFEGSIRGNDPWIALVRMELDLLEPGTYEFVVRETALRFTDLQHPERATDPTTSERRMTFKCH